MALSIARPYKGYSVVPGKSGGVLRISAQGLRPRGALSNACVPADGPGYRDERLGGAAPQVGRNVSARSRPRVERRRDRKAGQVPALYKRRRELRGVAHVAWRARQGLVLHARLWTQQIRGLPRNSR